MNERHLSFIILARPSCSVLDIQDQERAWISFLLGGGGQKFKGEVILPQLLHTLRLLN